MLQSMACESHFLTRGFVSSLRRNNFQDLFLRPSSRHRDPVMAISHSVPHPFPAFFSLRKLRPSGVCQNPFGNLRLSHTTSASFGIIGTEHKTLANPCISQRLISSPNFLTNGNTIGERRDRKSAGVPKKKLKQSQLTVAVDIDEVLGSFLMALNAFIAEEYLCQHQISEFYVYDFMKVWQCSRTEADLRVHSFFKSKHFDEGILPIPGAYNSLLQIASFCELFVVTSRQNIIKEETLSWVEKHYSGIFREVHFGNHFALEGEARTKSEICRCVGAQLLIDDNPAYAMDCARNGIEVLLFDLNNSYPWSKTQEGPEHPLITRVHNWQEVAQMLETRLSHV